LRARGSPPGPAELAIDVLEDGWVDVPLPASLFVRAARLGGRPLPITDAPRARRRRLGGRPHRVRNAAHPAVAPATIARHPRRRVPIAEVAGNEFIQLPPATGGLVRATLTVPRAGVAIVASGGTIVERDTDAGGPRVIAHAAFGQGLGLSWSRQRETAAASLPARLRGQLQHVVGLGEETALVTARVTVDVLRGGTAAFTLRVPPGLVVNQVQGAHVADWDVQGQTLTITLLDRIDRQVAVIVSGEFRPPASGRIDVPLLHLADAERESGAVAVEVLGRRRGHEARARGLDPTDPGDLGDLLSGRLSPAIVAFRYRGDRPDAERALALTLTRYAPQEVLLAAVDEARYRALVSEDGKALVEGPARRPQQPAQLPRAHAAVGATLWSVAVGRAPGAAWHRAEGQRSGAAAEAPRRQRGGAGRSSA
jgi:hypothetical protein